MEKLLKEVALTIHYLSTATLNHLETCTCGLCTRRDALEHAYWTAAKDKRLAP